MAFNQFELGLLKDALEQMREEGVQRRLCAFKELRKTPLNNEGWFEWELYYHLLKVDRGWKKEKKRRIGQKGCERPTGDGVDLQFSNNRFIELRVATTEKTNMRWILKGLIDHVDANAVLFLALHHKNLKKWMEKHTINGNRIRYKYRDKVRDYEIKTEEVNKDWIVGLVKLLSK